MNSNTTPDQTPEQLPPDEPPTEPMTQQLPARLRPVLDVARDIVAAFEANDGQVDAKILALDMEIECCVEATAIAIRELEAKAYAHTSLAKHYALQAAYSDHAVERATILLERALRHVGISDIRTKTAHAWFRKDKVIQVDEVEFRKKYLETHPEWFRVKDPEPNKTALKAWLKDAPAPDHVQQLTRESLQIK